MSDLQARKTALREQTIIIEDCQAELKQLLNKSVFGGVLFNVFTNKADKIINERVEEIEERELKIAAREALKLFSRQEFRRLRAVLMSRAGFSFAALASVKKIWNAESAKEKQTAFLKLQEIEPKFRTYQVAFAPGRGKSWRWGVPLSEYMETYMARVNETAAMLAKDSAKGQDGLSLRLKAELYIRGEANKEMLGKLYDSNDEFVWISSHENCSPRCQPFQGKLYNTKGKRGVLDGIPYSPLKEATDIKQQTKRGKVYINGIITGFGCRHYLIPYKKDGERPPTLRADRVEKAWEIDRKQRAQERKIYKLRESYYAYKDNDDDKALRYYHAAVKAREEYIAFSKENSVAFYPSRIRIDN